MKRIVFAALLLILVSPVFTLPAAAQSDEQSGLHSVCMVGVGCLMTPLTDEQITEQLGDSLSRIVSGGDIVPAGEWQVVHNAGQFSCVSGMAFDTPASPDETVALDPMNDKGDFLTVSGLADTDGAIIMERIGPGTFWSQYEEGDATSSGVVDVFMIATTEATLEGFIMIQALANGTECSGLRTFSGTLAE